MIRDPATRFDKLADMHESHYRVRGENRRKAERQARRHTLGTPSRIALSPAAPSSCKLPDKPFPPELMPIGNI